MRRAASGSCSTSGKQGRHRYRFRIDGDIEIPDPASHFQPDDVHGPSEVIDHAYDWKCPDWNGRPWHDAVFSELHVGTFTPEGTFRAAIEKLDHLAATGITAIELMPVADFPGRWNWGYDGVLLFAPDSSYGRPDDLKALVDAAHARGLMVFLDVVYNHFGPEGNYLGRIAPQIFHRRADALGRRHRLSRAGGAPVRHRERAALARANTASTGCASMPCTPSSRRGEPDILQRV